MNSFTYLTQEIEVTENSVIMEVDSSSRLELICLGFRGDEEIIRITRFIHKMHVDSIDIRIWYRDGSTETWTCGAKQSPITPLQHSITKQIQSAAYHYSGLTFETFKRI